MATSYSTATLFQDIIDKAVVQEMTSNVLEGDSSRIQWDGGKEIKIAKVAVGSMKDYSRTGGYKKAQTSLAWESKTFNMDRGVRYDVDQMDINETKFIPSASLLLGESARTKISPELDAFRYSQIAKKAYANGTTNGYIANESLTASNIFSKIFAALYAKADLGFNLTDLRVFLPWTKYTQLISSTEITKRIDPTQQPTDLKFQTRTIDGALFIPVSSSRMKSGYTFNAGTDDDNDDGGYTALTAALGINYLIVPQSAVMAKVKHQVSKIINPEQNQKYDGYSIYTRMYHDIFFMDNQVNGLWASFDAALPTTPTDAFNTIATN